MIARATQFADLLYDLCVIGSGPAGMIVALEYARRHPEGKVVLVEYGAETGTGANRLDDTIKIAKPAHHHEPYECTNKGLGGTSATWGGRCVMYDEIDFTDRPVVNAGCTWDTAFLQQCTRFISPAAEYFECGQGPFSLKGVEPWGEQSIAEGFVEGDVLDSTVERWSMPTRFGARYRGELERSENVLVLFGMEAREISTPDADSIIPSLSLREVASGTLLNVRARNFVLAAGTQETTRLLLRNPQTFARLGGVPDALGRYYQGHMSGKIASVVFRGDPKKTDYGLLRDENGAFFRRRFQLSTAVLEQENLLNTAIWLDNPLYHDPSHGSGALSMFYLAMITPVLGKRLAPRAIANSITKGKIVQLHRHLWNVLKGLPGSLWVPAMIFYRRYCVARKLPQIFLYNPANRYALHFHSEQVPNRENRMQLGADGESLEIHYEPTPADVDSVIRVHAKLDQWLRRCGCGQLEYWFEPGELAEQIRVMSRDGIHQSGTTRIADSPAQGVVDRDLRVWGTKNLYVCSGSVLPTSSQANPTFFTGVLAVRLARHL